MTTPETKKTKDPREVLDSASREQLLRLIEDIRKIPAWYDREPMGRA